MAAASEFQFQNLRPEDKEEWLDFVISVFTKTTRTYFANHLANDPNTDYNLIYTARNSENQIGIVSASHFYSIFLIRYEHRAYLTFKYVFFYHCNPQLEQSECL